MDVPNSTQSEVDPVCGMSVDPATAKFSAVHDGATFHFCSQRCQQKFTANPDQHTYQE